MEESAINKKEENNYIYESLEIEHNEIKTQDNYLFSKQNSKINLMILFTLIIAFCLFFIIYINNKSSINKNMEFNSKILNNINESKCPLGYKLIDNNCIINYSFKAKYFTNSDNEKIILFRNVSFDIIEIIIDEKKEEPLLEYKFPFKGEHEVYILLNISKCNSLKGMFSGITNIKSIYFSPLFDTGNVQLMDFMFYGSSSLTSLDLSNFRTENVTNMDNMFLGCSSLTTIVLSNFDTKNVKFMNKMFAGCSSLKSIDLSNFNTQSLTNMDYMFSGCSSLISINLFNFNTENVVEMEGLFFDCSSLISIDLSNFNTKNVRNMGGMFFKCSSLVSLNLSNFDTKSVLNMENMFYGCSSLLSINILNFETTNVKSMNEMFSGCSSLTSLNLSNFDTINVKSMNEMFYGCSNLIYLDISSFKNNYFSKISIFDDIYTIGNIFINKDFIEKIEDQIPINWNIIILK